MRQLARDAGVVTTITAIVVGAGLAAWSIGGVVHERNQLRAQAARPAAQPTVTVTATQAGQTPAPRPRRTQTRTVVEAQPADQQTASNGRAAGSDRSRSIPSGGDPTTAPRPAPGPSTTPPAVQPSTCDGAMSVRLPLGVLPRCSITIGGNR